MFSDLFPGHDPLIQQMRSHWLASDDSVLKPLMQLADIGEHQRPQAQQYAQMLVAKLRAEQQGKGGVDALLNEFSLSTEEGIALMCLAEALLRVPDGETADKLIRDKLQGGDWSSHLGRSHSSFVNASAWALLFTGKLVNYSDTQQRELHSALKRAAGRVGQPVIRSAVRRAMEIMGDVFVMGRSIEAAMTRAHKQEAKGYRYSFDMLGEGARTAQAADKYFEAYQLAIDAIGHRHRNKGPEAAAGISVKLSALHPRYESTQRERVLKELAPRLKALCLKAREYDIGLTVDAEEAARLEISLEVIEAVFSDAELRGWSGFGVAVQAYQKRAPLVIDWLAALSERVGRRIMVRLVKGAYWDSEIKLAQQQGLSGYPVFTRKPSTDVCYQACARKLLDYRPRLYPQFATHNAWSVAAILAMDEQGQGFEFQRLHGMGEALYQQVMADHKIPCRIYAPVGEHEDLLAYLVRRLLENGANSSFVNNIVDAHVPIESLTQDPLSVVQGWTRWQHPQIQLPDSIYSDGRKNSQGFDLSDQRVLEQLDQLWSEPMRDYRYGHADTHSASPSNTTQLVGGFEIDSAASMQDKLAKAERAYKLGVHWSPEQRAQSLERLADSLEQHREELMRLCIAEAGKTLADALAEVREAVDFCRYYARQARTLPQHESLGPVLCISPWNFPLAIFLGQVTGAIAAGNCVIAKPAEQSSLIALRSLELMQACEMPQDWVQCVLGPGPLAGKTLVPDSRIKAVLFTGSTGTARWLFQTLAQRADAPIPLIAETGGQNAMIVDSTALPEQVVDDVVRSGFQSAGQRCSALRVLFLQEEIADELSEMIRHAMNELRIGPSDSLQTDIGPVIDDAALERLQRHVATMAADDNASLLHQLDLPPGLPPGHYFAPCLYQLSSLDQLAEEVFGPVVHIIRYKASQQDAVIEQINRSGFGLTMGIHTRVQVTADRLAAQAQVGNVYVNRDMIGAVVGVQPFGGRGLSGTGPKAGGPLYVPQLCRTAVVDGELDQALSSFPLQLDSPTGERNLYFVEPRRSALACYALDDSIDHCRQVLTLSRRLKLKLDLLVPDRWRAELQLASDMNESDPGLRVLSGLNQLEPNTYDSVFLVPGSSLIQDVMGYLAAQTDAALPRVICLPANRLHWHHLVAEKCISTNTTAAGGNASLMTMQA